MDTLCMKDLRCYGVDGANVTNGHINDHEFRHEFKIDG